jgi:DNA-binding XRE family transcriptional regulator
MTVATRTERRWDTGTYGQIRSASYARGQLSIEFADGARAQLPVGRLRSAHLRGAEWPRIRFTRDEIIVPTPGGEAEISWFSLRALTDAEFAAYLGEFAANESRRVGYRMRMLREERGLTVEDVAARVGVSADVISGIEEGEQQVGFDRLESVLMGMDRTLSDLGRPD